jgi:Mrp family chromosome partitioning ATPase
VTTLAAGLAASLSETGEGNVLLIDMNLENGAAHPFFKGKPACGLDDVLEEEKRGAAQVQENLYVVHGGVSDDRLPKLLPKRLAHLLPKLHASDYDYIIFDMPPVTQTSVTPRLAGFMDMVFLVVESEKTSREYLKQAANLLVRSKANIGAVFNKRRNYVPARLHQEF